MKKFIIIVLLSLSLFSSESIPTQEEVAKLYVATFNRAPDAAGLAYWVNNSGLKLSEIAQSFFEQPETQTLYPSSTANREFIKSVYQNLFNRDPDSDGWNYWEEQLNNNVFSKNRFIEAVINGAKDDDVTVLVNKTDVGLHFASSGLDDVDTAKSIMSTITADVATVTAAFSEMINDVKIVINKVVLPTTGLYPNSLHTIELEIYFPQSNIVDRNDSSIFFFFSLEDVNDPTSITWFETDSLSEIKEGTNTYEFEFLIPELIEPGTYTLNIDIGDNKSTLYEYKSSSFSILTFDNKADLEIVSLTLDLEHDGYDSEFDSTSSSEINATAISLSDEILPAISLEIIDKDEPFEISSSMVIKSNMKDSSNIQISACIDITSECLAIPILKLVADSNETISAQDEDDEVLVGTIDPVYITEIEVPSLEANTEKTINLDLQLSVNDVDTLVTKIIENLVLKPNALFEATLKVTISSDDEGNVNLTQNNTTSYPLEFSLDSELLSSLTDTSIIDGIDTNITDEIDTDIVDSIDIGSIGTPSFAPILKSSVSGECGLRKLKYEKEYKKHKYGRRFGAGAYLLGKGWLDSDGVHAKVYGSIRVRRFSDTKFRIFRMLATADINPGSFEDTGYDIELSSLGKTIYTKSYSLAESAALSTPIVELSTEEEKRISTSSTSTSTDANTTSDTNTTTSTSTVTSRSTLLKQKRIKAVKDKLRTYTSSSSTTATLVSLEKNWRISKGIERKKTIMFSIIPIVISAGAESRIGFDASIGLDGVTSITAMIEPNAYIGAYLEAGVGFNVECCWVEIEYSAGAGSWLWLLSERFTTKVVGSLDFVEDGDYITELKGALNNNVTNYLSTMKGKTYAYARYYGPRKFSEPTETDWKNRRRTKTFADWSGGKYTRTLLNKNWNLFSIELADECN